MATDARACRQARPATPRVGLVHEARGLQGEEARGVGGAPGRGIVRARRQFGRRAGPAAASACAAWR